MRCRPPTPAGSETLDHGRDRLAEADAHGDDAVALAAALQLAQQRRGHTRAGRSQRVPERDAAAVGVHVVPPLLEPRVARGLQDDGRERLVDLDDADLVPAEPGATERP